MNHITNYLLFSLIVFFSIVIFADRLSKLHLFEAMTGNNDANNAPPSPVNEAKKKIAQVETPVITHNF